MTVHAVYNKPYIEYRSGKELSDECSYQLKQPRILVVLQKIARWRRGREVH